MELLTKRPPQPLQRRGLKSKKLWFNYDISMNFDNSSTYKATSPTPSKEGLEKQKPGYVTANPLSYSIIKMLRKELKENPTEAEKLLWEYLKNKQTDHKIRRQHIIDNFIADFVCLPKKLVIEVDGKIHDFQKEYDLMRNARFTELGYTTIRFTNIEVKSKTYEVFLKIKQTLDQTEEPNSPPLEGLGEVI